MWGILETHQGVVWNPNDADASFTISNHGLTITGGGGSGGGSFVSARAKQKLQQNQKLYFEYTVNSTSQSYGIGIANANASLSTYIGGDNNGASYYSGGLWAYQGGQTSGMPDALTNDIWAFAIDAVNDKLWTRQNGGNWNNDVIGNQNPATNTGGFSCPSVFSAGLPIMLGFYSNNPTSEMITINCGTSAFSYTPPAGFYTIDAVATQ